MAKKIAYSIYCSVCAIALAWLLFSWLDIVADNTSSKPEHSEYNAFVWVEEVAQ
jgi:hypothetical protein